MGSPAEVTLRLGDILQRMLGDRDRLWGERVAWVFCPVEIRVLAGVSVSVIGSPSVLVFHLQSGEGLLWPPPQPLSLPWIRWAPSRSLASGRLARIVKRILGVSEHMGTRGKSPGMLAPPICQWLKSRGKTSR